ncbi:peptidoglycan D,D-transpeptidase FtsI family protein [Chamaesiphon minutus]|uniref:Cell division protein FtsI/penicillin-binding protein 2 n=1 Tax=Chamaesiphon minutus (strain ATCC 27169 / PCC 6605) TaxID=1173020 RepID=K9UMC1_CHAP6|nr:penicillin-binding protein 2 [Chamaesiphon minutus]AFY95783.1 cell division protein FtsI/penicillin-binding protein 2 [Chamaesiphon minutus PCC 6605]
MSNIHRKKSVQIGGNRHKSTRLTVKVNRTIARTIAVWSTWGLATLMLLARLVWLQIIEAPKLQEKAKEQQRVTMRSVVPRRTIVDRSNDRVAIDRLSYTVFAHPEKFTEVVRKKGSKTGLVVAVTPADMAQRLAPIVGRTVQDLTTKFQQRKTGVFVGSGLREDTRNRIRALKVEGVEIVQGELDYTRFYPQDDMLAEVLGYLDWQRQPQAGVEYSQTTLLERKVVPYNLTKTARGEILPDRVTLDFLHTDDLQLRLSIDLRLQRAARTALKQKMKEWNALRGTVIVMDADTGALRSLVVEPTYNPNQYGKDVQNYSKIVGEKRAATLLRNWAVSDLYEPGSTFKPIAVAIALENGVIEPKSTFIDDGSITVGTDTIRNSDKKGNGKLDIAQILQHSSNVGMVKMMQRLKPDVYYNWLQRIGLGQKSGIDLPLEERGEIRSRREFVASPIYPANTAFGQGFSLTPIQLVTLIGSLANGGKLVTPHVVEGLYDSAGVRKDKNTLPEPTQIFSSHNARSVLAMMETVVTHGSGARAEIPGYRIAGKTGTSQKAMLGGYKQDGKKITSFVGILPVDGQHRYVVFAAVDEPKGKEKAFGSNVAAPIVKSVMDSLISLDGIPPSDPSAVKNKKTDKTEIDKDKTETIKPDKINKIELDDAKAEP